MAKELPFFKFEPAEYLTRDVSFCSMSAQGLFINICSMYWQRTCIIKKDQILRKFNHENEFNELVDEGIIDVKDDGFIKIKFLDLQYKEATNTSRINSENGKLGGRPKAKKNRNESETKPNEKPNESETKGIREDKIIEEEIKEDNKIKQKQFISIFDLEIPKEWKDEILAKWMISAKTLEYDIIDFNHWYSNTTNNSRSLPAWKTKLHEWIDRNNAKKPVNKSI